MIKGLYAVEISGVCNQSCDYCPYYLQQRQRGLMEWNTLGRVYELIKNKMLIPSYPLHLHLFGEPMLHPDFEDMAKKMKEVCPHLSFSTNGTKLDHRRGYRLAEIGFEWITVSPHDVNKAISAMYLLRSCGVKTVMHGGPDHNWAAQVEHPVKWSGRCEFERDQKVVVRWNGDVAVCCITDSVEGVIGTIWDEDLTQKECVVMPMCRKCHLERRNYGEGNETMSFDWIETVSG